MVQPRDTTRLLQEELKEVKADRDRAVKEASKTNNHIAAEIQHRKLVEADRDRHIRLMEEMRSKPCYEAFEERDNWKRSYELCLDERNRYREALEQIEGDLALSDEMRRCASAALNKESHA